MSAHQRNEYRQTIISNRKTIQSLEDRIEERIEERLEVVYKKSSAESLAPLVIDRLDHVSPPNTPQ
ncbi:hypothetical protein NHQ30_000303 [Ciborinia camelliae]|nr:hypothetical protein NHQ30_000303 [Ciborinia camelliae]